ncbi:MAG TPA: cytochrome d ubiquinol oxidase subunit II [Candidatus Limnocylindrales bacterium]|jgi:cytochrome d ubiquinol oxidase subunit II|nr:cytochrome d ubiquinol oxidase subunit II [Candidatus Limnocylindrales bacterium]
MSTIWFMIVAVMVAIYVLLDGFDIGAGAVHLIIARNDTERRTILRAIGPVWDGNEVWLLAAGGTLYFAFPLLYASSFSGFYLPLIIVLWLLMLRGIGIEFRSHIHDSLWTSFFDVIFSIASILLAIFFGAALGNVVRGVPLNADGYFFEPLWTNFRAGTNNGILDWYTVIMGVVALVTLVVHGSLYVATKTEGDLNTRARRVAFALWPVEILLTVVSLAATLLVRPGILTNFSKWPIGYLVPVVVVGSLVYLLIALRQKNDKGAFLASCGYIVGMLVGAAFALYPMVLPASTDPNLSLTIYNTAAGAHGLSVGFVWWTLGMVLAFTYFVFIYRMFRGKVQVEEGEGSHGY